MAMKTIKVVVTAAALLVSGLGAAVAQDWPGQGIWSGPMLGFGYPTPDMMGYGRPGPRMMRSDGAGQTVCNTTAGHIDDRLAAIKAELKITPVQEPLWTTYATAARDSANAALARCPTTKSRRGNAAVSLPDRLDQNEQLMAAQLNAMRAANAALKPLYAALSDSQKKSADRLLLSRTGMM
jgi:LTXXQ motif family protein